MAKLEPFSRPLPRWAAISARQVLFEELILSAALFAGPALATDVVSEGAGGSSWMNALMAGLGLLVLAVLTVGGLVLWGRKQDRISIMTTLSMRSLIDSKSEAESSIAAKTLAGAKDAGALLVLFAVYSDDNVGKVLHKTAGDALKEMSTHFRKHREVIEVLIAAAEENDHKKVIDVLIRNFEGGNRVYVQTAFVIGREFSKLGKFVEARDWLQTAAFRNRQKPLYGGQIRRMIDATNARMFMRGDALFQESNLHEAKKCFSEASHGLDEASKRRFVPFVRLACVYCKLRDYEDAAQATTLALRHQQEPEAAGTLSELISDLLSPEQETQAGDEHKNRLRSDIDDLAIGTMDRLAANAAVN